MMRRSVVSLALVLVFVLGAPARAQQSTLDEVLTPLIEAAGLPGTLGVHVVRLSDARELYTMSADRAFNPASNLKLLTAAAALRTLGPSHQFVTSLHGHIVDGRVRTLVVRGGGDPSLRSRDVSWLAEQLVARGVRRVDRVVADATAFDSQRLPPAFEQQPNETAAFRASVSALSIDRNAYVLHVRPGEVGSPAELYVWANKHLLLRNNIMTTEKGRPRVQVKHAVLADGRMRVNVSGTVPRTASALTYRKRIDDPVAHARTIISEVLTRAGIKGEKRVAYKHPGALPPLLAEWHSPPLSEILYAVGKWSDNFTAEMLLKSLGAKPGIPGTSAAGAQRVYRSLVDLGVNADGIRIVNGSGLFRGNQVKPRHLTATLRVMSRAPSISNEYFAHLATGGVDGTLAKRLTELPDGVTVRAKTGTLNDVVALSGYILPGVRRHAVAFSIIANGIGGRARQAKALADAIVLQTANWLKSQPKR